jgi:Arm DNA-binding domain
VPSALITQRSRVQIPPSATKVRGPFHHGRGLLLTGLLTALRACELTGSWFHGTASFALGGIAGDVHGRQRPADDQLGERGRYLAVRLQIALDILFDIEPDPLTGRRRQQTKSGFESEKEAWRACRDAMSDTTTLSLICASSSSFPRPLLFRRATAPGLRVRPRRSR